MSLVGLAVVVGIVLLVALYDYNGSSDLAGTMSTAGGRRQQGDLKMVIIGYLFFATHCILLYNL